MKIVRPKIDPSPSLEEISSSWRGPSYPASLRQINNPRPIPKEKI